MMRLEAHAGKGRRACLVGLWCSLASLRAILVRTENSCPTPNAPVHGRRFAPSFPTIRPPSEPWYGVRMNSGAVKKPSKATSTCPERKASGSPESKAAPSSWSSIPLSGARACAFLLPESSPARPACSVARTSIESRSGSGRRTDPCGGSAPPVPASPADLRFRGHVPARGAAGARNGRHGVWTRPDRKGSSATACPPRPEYGPEHRSSQRHRDNVVVRVLRPDHAAAIGCM